MPIVPKPPIDPSVQRHGVERAYAGLITALLSIVLFTAILIALEPSDPSSSSNTDTLQAQDSLSRSYTSPVPGTDYASQHSSEYPEIAFDGHPSVGALAGSLHSKVNLKKPEDVFLEIIPVLKTADDERWAICYELASRVEIALRKIDQLPVPKELVSEITSLGSKASYLADSNGHRKWIAKEFSDYVISSDDLANIVRGELAAFQAKLVDIDNQLLVDLKADIDCDPASLQLKPIVFDSVQASIRNFQSDIAGTIAASLQEDLASIFVSMAAEEVGRRGALAWYADENGEVTPFQEFSAMIVGSITGLVADQVVSQVANVDEKVIEKCLQARASLLIQVMPAYENGKLWFDDACKHAGEHRNVVLFGIISELNIDVDWALREYVQAVASLEAQ